MKIDKAIEALTEVVDDYADQLWDEAIEATQLGIEALKGVKESRRKWGVRGVATLPEETPD